MFRIARRGTYSRRMPGGKNKKASADSAIRRRRLVPCLGLEPLESRITPSKLTLLPVSLPARGGPAMRGCVRGDYGRWRAIDLDSRPENSPRAFRLVSSVFWMVSRPSPVHITSPFELPIRLCTEKAVRGFSR